MRKHCHKLASALRDSPFFICAKPRISKALDAAKLFSPCRLCMADKRRCMIGNASGIAPRPRRTSRMRGLKPSIGRMCQTLQLTASMPGGAAPSSASRSSRVQRLGSATILNCCAEGNSTSASCGKAEQLLMSVGTHGGHSMFAAAHGSMTKRTGSEPGLCNAKSCHMRCGSLQAEANPSMMKMFEKGVLAVQHFRKSVCWVSTHLQLLPCQCCNFPVGSEMVSCSNLTNGARPMVCIVWTLLRSAKASFTAGKIQDSVV
mmetsp:Transcript_35757/g.82052  ORF Transcript_35757/g.82052 Transcript_35757/m.82052 type:complete len:260 (+) Transcript_35757:1063-1842(+)